MQNPRDPNRDPYIADQPVEGAPVERERYVERRVVEEPVARERYSPPAPTYELADLVRWGPIIAGFAATLATLFLLSILGTAIGLSTAADATSGEMTSFGTIWGVLSLVLAFFIGGWIGSRTSAVGGSLPAVINSSIVWAFTLLFLLFLAGIGAAGVVGALNTTGGVNLPTIQATGEQAAAGAWGALAGLVITLVASIIGGMVGMHRESEFFSR